MDNVCGESIIAAPAVTDTSSEEPIKISIYTSDDGQFHMKYDDCSDDNEMPKSKRKSNANKASMVVKPTTETLYEIDLYCDVCNHDYKSLMSLNRHMRTRKHLNQLAKLNEANEQRMVGPNWTNYDNYLNACDLLPHNVYDSIVHSLLNEGNNGVDATEAAATDTSSEQNIDLVRDFQNIYESFAMNDSAAFSDIHEAMDVTANNDGEYDENKAFVDAIQRSVCNSYKCLICGELFASAQLLSMHTHQMRENCVAKIADDEFDFETELKKLEIPWNFNENRNRIQLKMLFIRFILFGAPYLHCYKFIWFWNDNK